MSLDTCGRCGASGFARAIEELKAGRRVARSGWNGKGMWLELQRPDAGSKMTLPYIFMRTVQGDLVPWLASQTDLLAEDWVLVAAAEFGGKERWAAEARDPEEQCYVISVGGLSAGQRCILARLPGKSTCGGGAAHVYGTPLYERSEKRHVAELKARVAELEGLLAPVPVRGVGSPS